MAIRITMRIQEFFKRFFIYYCDSYRQPRIKHGNPQWRFELSECSLVNFGVEGDEDFIYVSYFGVENVVITQ